GALVFERSTIAEGTGAATRVVEACQESGALSVEAWVTANSPDIPATAPARMVTMSIDENDQAFVLGQDDRGEVVGRVRTSTDTHETRAADVLVPGQLQHLVFTRRPTGETAVYVDGELATPGSVI